MGIKDWYKLFADDAVRFTDKDFKGKAVAVDVSGIIYKASLGMAHLHSLTDSDGNPTALLNVLLCNIVKYKKMGVTGLIYVFDNPKPTVIKGQEYKRRKAARDKAATKLKKDVKDGKTVDNLRKRLFSPTKQMIDDVKKMLTLMGVAWIVAPEEFEAEHLGAELSKAGIVDLMVTDDSDTLLFGCKAIVRKNKKIKKNEIYTLATILEKRKITYSSLVHLGVVMGSDFAPKTPRIGPASYFKKGFDAVLTSVQTAAKQYFLSECPLNTKDINTSTIDKVKLVKWLVDHKNFNTARVEKMLKVF